MPPTWLVFLTTSVLAHMLCAQEILFQDDFKGKLGQGWSWVREHSGAWRLTEAGLEVRLEPGNMWGPQNNARNVLVRPAPDVTGSGIEVSVRVENKPAHQYEQVDLVWYCDDSNMVKLGQELVDGKLSVVMGREENDKTRTVAIIPVDSTNVQLRLLVRGGRIRGQFRTPGVDVWREAGECNTATPKDERARISLQFYQGPAEVEHWARVTQFRILRQQTGALTTEQAGALARHLANERAQSLYNCRPFRNGRPAQFAQGHWRWRDRRGHGTCDLEATVEFEADGGKPKVELIHLDSQSRHH